MERLPSNGKRLELVKGKVYEMAPAGGRHGYLAMNIGITLGNYVKLNGIGRIFAAETGFILKRDPDTMRAPDVAFITETRLPVDDIPDSYIEIVPDLVVEVVSPSDSRRDVEEKIEDWLDAGVRLVWVIRPATRSATVYGCMKDALQLSEGDSLNGEDVVPGFSCRVGDLFD